MITVRSISFAGIALVGLAAIPVLLAQPPAGGRGFRGGFGGFGPDLPNFAGKTITGSPFSATLNTQHAQTLSNGSQIQHQETGEVARDSNGRVYLQVSSTRATSSGNQTFSRITIYDPVAGYIYNLNPQKMTAVQMPIRQRTPPTTTLTPSNNSQIRTASLGTQAMNGVSATGTQVTRTIPAGTIGNSQPIQVVRSTWMSTELQIPVHTSSADPRNGNSSMDLTNIVQSEPNGSLFTVPSGYTLTTESGRFRHPARQ